MPAEAIDPLARKLDLRLTKENLNMKVRGLMPLLLAIAGLTILPPLAMARSLADSQDSSSTVASTTPAQLDLAYMRPTQATKLRNYAFDAFDPYPIVGAGLAAGINQVQNTPPEWKQGAEDYGKRIGSDFGIAAVTTTTRYALSEAFKEDALYYRCQCKGLFPRLRHAIDFDLDSTPRRRWPPRLLFPGAGRSVCRYHDCRLCVVSRPLRRQGWFPNRQLQLAGV